MDLSGFSLTYLHFGQDSNPLSFFSRTSHLGQNSIHFTFILETNSLFNSAAPSITVFVALMISFSGLLETTRIYNLSVSGCLATTPANWVLGLLSSSSCIIYMTPISPPSIDKFASFLVKFPNSTSIQAKKNLLWI
uniref:Uncharacterized protein n=1 Tax=uncultured marine crenarchaeote HF4000_ANIW133C7 TaxID=455570 RepID=B3T3S6_9ARCH|nr:hypothetical protein ALOHA_HF4000ANIW133C7ctg1g42 [uncultured marine crenarchaeote HF4000_ANIW133C7]